MVDYRLVIWLLYLCLTVSRMYLASRVLLLRAVECFFVNLVRNLLDKTATFSINRMGFDILVVSLMFPFPLAVWFKSQPKHGPELASLLLKVGPRVIWYKSH
ncbi:hypothetical protein J3A83DRAFT_4210320 [Scleroderma citrinum]